MEEIKLKPCPFCGGKAEFAPCTGLLNAVRVRCTVCNCATAPVGVVTDGGNVMALAEAGAATVWNNRCSEKLG